MTEIDVKTRTSERGDSGAPPLLSVENIEVVYNDVSLAVRGISFAVPHGAAVALLGANGAGKTTTIRAISGLLDLHDGKLREGDVILAGRSLRRLRADKIVPLGIAQVPEGRMVFAYLNVEENLRVGASARRDGANVSDALAQVYDLFPALKRLRTQQAGWLSGGEQQMVAVGRALMAAPQLLLLDEVSLGLAPRVVDSIFEQLRQVRADLGTAMLMVEQNARLALGFTEYAYIMESGRIVLDGASAAVIDNPDVQEFYLGLSADKRAKSYAEVKHYRRRKRWLQ